VTFSQSMDTSRKARPAAQRRPQSNTAATVPTLEEARSRLIAARGRPQPWLTPEAFEAAETCEMAGPMVGPEIYRKP
jgi:hypothetical protein